MGAYIYICLLLHVSIMYSSSHKIKLGKCPSVQVMEGFSFEKMQGVWYVIQKTDTTSSCMTLDFRERDGKKSVVESCKPLGVSIPHVMEKFRQTGKLRIPDDEEPAKMTVAYPVALIPFSAVDFWVMDTDYTTYAAIWSCRNLLGMGHRQSAMILSRDIVLDQVVINQLRDKFQSYDVEKHSLSIVDQRGCPRNLNPLPPDDLENSKNRPIPPATQTETQFVTKTYTEVITKPPKTETLTETKLHTSTTTQIINGEPVTETLTSTETQVHTEVQKDIETVTITTTAIQPAIENSPPETHTETQVLTKTETITGSPETHVLTTTTTQIINGEPVTETLTSTQTQFHTEVTTLVETVTIIDNHPPGGSSGSGGTNTGNEIDNQGKGGENPAEGENPEDPNVVKPTPVDPKVPSTGTYTEPEVITPSQLPDEDPVTDEAKNEISDA